MTSPEGITTASGQYGWRALCAEMGRAALILAPFGYLGMLIAVAVHEVAGHGLAAAMVGGRCLRFTMDFQGMGWAYTLLPFDSPLWKHLTMLAGGVTATTVTGLLTLVLAVRARKPLVSLALLLVSVNLLLEGTAYVFWNAVSPSPIGDIGRIISMADRPWLGPALMATGGILMFGAIGGAMTLLFRRLEGWLGVEGQLHGGQRLGVLCFLAVLFGAFWFVFDWDRLCPGLGQTPNVVGAVAGAIAALCLYGLRSHPAPSRPTRRAFVLTALAGYVMLGLAMAAIALWLLPR